MFYSPPCQTPGKVYISHLSLIYMGGCTWTGHKFLKGNTPICGEKVQHSEDCVAETTPECFNDNVFNGK